MNSAIDCGHANAVSFDEVYRWLDDGTIFESLAKKIPGEFDFSLFSPDSPERAALLEALRGSAAALRGRERRKTGVENTGLCLLMALLLEAIQQNQRE